MTWKVRDVMGQRIEFVVRALRGEGVQQLCQEYEISRQTGHLWLRRYKEAGSFTALENRSRVAKRIWNRSSEAVTDKVLELRREHGWAGRKIQKVLDRDHGVRISARTVDRILDRENCIDNRDRKRSATTRFERPEANQLWQMDFKGQYRMDEPGECFPFTILDDHSRYLVGLHALPNTRTVGVEQRLIETFKRYGVPDQMLMDHGTPWWNVANEPGITKISVLLMKQGIRISYSGVGHPQTQGKVERLHRTLKAALRRKGLPRVWSQWQARLDEFRHIYNHVRPHEALEMNVPATRYQPSWRPYVERPADWNYSADFELIRLNSQGSFSYAGRPCFVSRALADETVGIRKLASHLLVCYRSTYVREIHLNTGRSVALMVPVNG
jgi:transposase InsO family protein